MKNKSFTLIELLMVISIIGLISSIALVQLKGAREKAGIAKSLEFSSSIQHILGAEAVGVWKFEESGGTVLDISGYSNNGTVTGAASTAGILGSALLFDGSGDYVNFSGNSDILKTREITVEMWINRNFVGGNQVMIDINQVPFSSSVNGYSLVFQGAALRFRLGNGSNIYEVSNSSLSWTAGKWYHIAATYDGVAEGRVYVDGDLVASINNAGIGAIAYPTICSCIYRVGASGWTGGANQPFNGIIDEVRIYGQTLSTSQIQKHYAQGVDKHSITLR